MEETLVFFFELLIPHMFIISISYFDVEFKYGRCVFVAQHHRAENVMCVEHTYSN